MKKLKIKNSFTIFSLIFIILIAFFAMNKYFTNINIKKMPESSTDDSSNSSYYKTLYGTWTVTKHIPSKMKTTLSNTIISFCIGQKFTIDKDQITSTFATLSNLTINEGIMTSLDFSNTYNDTFKNLGISGNEVEYIKVTEADSTNHSVTILISNDGKVYALLSGAFFELVKE
jgi:hypothetical protein